MIYYQLGLYKGFYKKIEKCLFLPRMVAIGAVIQLWVNRYNSLQTITVTAGRIWREKLLHND